MITAAQIQVEIPSDIYRTAMYENGVEVSGRLDALIANAALFADDAGSQLILACNAVYRLARTDPAKNPFAERAADLLKRASEAPAVPEYDSALGEAGIGSPTDLFNSDEQDGL